MTVRPPPAATAALVLAATAAWTNPAHSAEAAAAAAAAAAFSPSALNHPRVVGAENLARRRRSEGNHRAFGPPNPGGGDRGPLPPAGNAGPTTTTRQRRRRGNDPPPPSSPSASSSSSSSVAGRLRLSYLDDLASPSRDREEEEEGEGSGGGGGVSRTVAFFRAAALKAKAVEEAVARAEAEAEAANRAAAGVAPKVASRAGTKVGAKADDGIDPTGPIELTDPTGRDGSTVAEKREAEEAAAAAAAAAASEVQAELRAALSKIETLTTERDGALITSLERLAEGASDGDKAQRRDGATDRDEPPQPPGPVAELASLTEEPSGKLGAVQSQLSSVRSELRTKTEELREENELRIAAEGMANYMEGKVAKMEEEAESMEKKMKERMQEEMEERVQHEMQQQMGSMEERYGTMARDAQKETERKAKELKAKMEEGKAKLDKVTEEKDVLKVELGSMQEDKIELKGRVKELTRLLESALEGKSKRLDDEYDKADDDKSDDVKAAEEKADGLAAKRQLAEQTEAVGKLGSELEQVKAQLKTVKSTRDDLKIEIDAVRKEAAQKVKDAEDKLVEERKLNAAKLKKNEMKIKDGTKKKMKVDNHNKTMGKKKADDDEKKSKEKQEELDAARAQNEELRGQVTDVSMALDDTREELNMVRSAWEASQKKNRELLGAVTRKNDEGVQKEDGEKKKSSPTFVPPKSRQRQHDASKEKEKEGKPLNGTAVAAPDGAANATAGAANDTLVSTLAAGNATGLKAEEDGEEAKEAKKLMEKEVVEERLKAELELEGGEGAKKEKAKAEDEAAHQPAFVAASPMPSDRMKMKIAARLKAKAEAKKAAAMSGERPSSSRPTAFGAESVLPGREAEFEAYHNAFPDASESAGVPSPHESVAPVDNTRSPGLLRNFYDISTSDFKRPHGAPPAAPAAPAAEADTFAAAAMAQSSPQSAFGADPTMPGQDFEQEREARQAAMDQYAAQQAASAFVPPPPPPASDLPPVDLSRSPGLLRNFYDSPTADFKRPHGAPPAAAAFGDAASGATAAQSFAQPSFGADPSMPGGEVGYEEARSAMDYTARPATFVPPPPVLPDPAPQVDDSHPPGLRRNFYDASSADYKRPPAAAAPVAATGSRGLGPIASMTQTLSGATAQSSAEAQIEERLALEAKKEEERLAAEAEAEAEAQIGERLDMEAKKEEERLAAERLEAEADAKFSRSSAQSPSFGAESVMPGREAEFEAYHKSFPDAKAQASVPSPHASAPPVDNARSPGLLRNFYDISTADFKRPHGAPPPAAPSEAERSAATQSSAHSAFGAESSMPGREAEYEGQSTKDISGQASAFVPPPPASDLPPVDNSRSPGLLRNFYDIPTSDFKRPHGAPPAAPAAAFGDAGSAATQSSSQSTFGAESSMPGREAEYEAQSTMDFVAQSSTFVSPPPPPASDLPPVDNSRSPGLRRNFYDTPTSDFKRPHGAPPAAPAVAFGGAGSAATQSSAQSTFGAESPMPGRRQAKEAAQSDRAAAPETATSATDHSSVEAAVGSESPMLDRIKMELADHLNSELETKVKARQQPISQEQP